MNVVCICGSSSYLPDCTRARPAQCCYIANRPTGPAPVAMTVLLLPPSCDHLHRDVPRPASPHPPLLFQTLLSLTCEICLRPSPSCPPLSPPFLPRAVVSVQGIQNVIGESLSGCLSSILSLLLFRPITTTEGASSPCCARGSRCSAPFEVRTEVLLSCVQLTLLFLDQLMLHYLPERPPPPPTRQSVGLDTFRWI